ncbi:MAG TPA: hypothetical protein PK843_17375 [bacterium]|nr:hypothetical protein [bacterium]
MAEKERVIRALFQPGSLIFQIDSTTTFFFLEKIFPPRGKI